LRRPCEFAALGLVVDSEPASDRAPGANIALAPGAEDNALALWLADRVGRNVRENDLARRAFQNLRAAVAMVAPDRGSAATLRFDHGYLTVHDGMLGIPDITFCADYQVLVGLGDLVIGRLGAPLLPPLSFRGMSLWRRSAIDVMSGELKIYGLLGQPRLVLRVLRVLGRKR
jgi:hypothetical protein